MFAISDFFVIFLYFFIDFSLLFAYNIPSISFIINMPGDFRQEEHENETQDFADIPFGRPCPF